MQQGDALGPYHSPEGVSFEGKKVPDHLMPARLIVFPSIDPDEISGIEGVPVGHTAQEGLSFSYTCGLAACIWQKYPQLSVGAMRRVIHTAAKSAKPQFGLTEVGMPTWESAERAIASLEDHWSNDLPMPSRRYEEVQAMPWPDRIDTIRRDPHISSDILLNSLPQSVPREYRGSLVSLCADGKDPQTRAALLLVARPDEDDQSGYDLLQKALGDPSPLALGCALDLLRRQPSLMGNNIERVSELINHQDGRVRVEALMAVEKNPDQIFVQPLIDGMSHDLDEGPLNAFYLREKCLETITGKSGFRGARGMHPGESFFSSYWIRKRRQSVVFWNDYRKAGDYCR